MGPEDAPGGDDPGRGQDGGPTPGVPHQKQPHRPADSQEHQGQCLPHVHDVLVTTTCNCVHDIYKPLYIHVITRRAAIVAPLCPGLVHQTV